MQANSWHHKFYPFECGMFEKEEKKLQKLEYIENENSFLDETKSIFIVFEGLSFDEKLKIADISFNDYVFC